MSDNRTTELRGILDEFEYECFMLRVEASETRARGDVVLKSYERILDDFAERIAEHYTKLPVDADGVPIRVGDIMERVDGGPSQQACCICSGGFNDAPIWCARDFRHVKPRSLEDALTAEQVREVIERHSAWVIGNNRCFHDGAYEEIADELNAKLGSGTCEFSPTTDNPPTCSNCGWQDVGEAFDYGRDDPREICEHFEPKEGSE